MVLVEESAIMSFDYIKTLPANKREEYAKSFYEFNSLYQNRKISIQKFPPPLLTLLDQRIQYLKRGNIAG